MHLYRQEPGLLSDATLARFVEDGDFLFNSAEVLFSLLLDAASRCERNIVCILDALDECSNFKLLANTLTDSFAGDGGPSNLKFILTSRPYESIRNALATLPKIHLSGESEEEVDQIAEEIGVVIEQRIRQLATLRRLTDSQEQSLRSVLRGTQQRTYLWVHLIFESLEEANILNRHSLTEAIQTLPLSVEEAYDKILSKSRNTKHVTKVLQLVVAAARPLHLKEVAVALTLDSQKHRTYANLMADVTDTAELQNEIRDLCGLFVVIIDGRLYLLHQTAREFLVDKDQRMTPHLRWQSSIDVNIANAVLAGICMRFLLLLQLKIPDEPDDKLLAKTFQEHDFLEYAVTYWPEHYRQAEAQAAAELDFLAQRLCSEEIWWLNIYLTIEDATQVPRMPLEIAGHLGLTSLIQPFLQLLKSDAADAWLDPSVGWWDTGYTLPIASRHGHTAFVDTLLKSDAFQSVRSWRPILNPFHSRHIHGTLGRALLLAASHGHYRVVELLLQAGANAKYTAYDGGPSPLSQAARRGADDVVGLLIKYGARSGIEPSHLLQNGTSCFNPLTKAAFDGDCTQVQLLLEEAHAIDAIDAAGDTALLRATKQGHCDAVVLLLDHNAAVDAADPDGRTSLLCAVEARNETIIRLLLERGADISARLRVAFYGEHHLTILDRAIRLGKGEIVELLLRQSPRSETFERCRDSAFWAIQSTEMAELLLKYGTSPDLKNPSGIPLLAHFAGLGHRDIVQALLDHSARIDVQEDTPPVIIGDRFPSFYCMPLAVAASKAHMEVMRLLIDRGARLDAGDSKGHTPLMCAASGGHTDASKLLLDHGAQVEARDKLGCTAFLYAVNFALGGTRSWECGEILLRVLLGRGARVDTANNNGHAALHSAATRDGGGAVVRFLLSHGAPVDMPDKKGTTPLMLAAFHGEVNALELLLAAGAQAAMTDSDGHTALWWVYQSRWITDAAQILRAAGAAEPISVKHRLRRYFHDPYK
ncbi:ankyrin repeat-containing domain protein [Microdochium trichocladiopsis]|uniref:Ankyrin repeat-containing domain protein n=1 Tax=Microdochium trichocladiopsis TaxID=1682393 RepID=A0A9P8Y7J7_9PEZI|nr:ankyrin repeat-containing domain protein [Microdochium trichocladiopsis]KAH7029512.1 ankyrin repeat-containing domain protein [Microdochium trichocladiopsis]